MRIGVNGRFLKDLNTGIGQYTFNILKSLAKLEKENEIVVFVTKKIKAELPKNVEIVVVPEMNFGTAGIKKTHWEQFKVPDAMKEHEVDVALFPYPSNPWRFSWLENGIKTVVAVHDVIPWTDSRYVKGILSKLYQWKVKNAVKMADKVLTVSECSKKEIVKVCEVNSRRVFVAYNDAADVYKKKNDLKVAEEVLRRFKLESGKYILYVGGYDVRKNVKFLVDEYKGAEIKMPLVLAGAKLHSNSLYESASVTGEGLIKTGLLNEESLNALYANCYCFVNLSEAEGFNLPVLEAAYCGAPCVVSDIKVHRELYEGFVLFASLKKGGFKKAWAEIKKKRTRDKYVKQTQYMRDKFDWMEAAKVVKEVLTSK